MDPINLSETYPFDKKRNLERGSCNSVCERDLFMRLEEWPNWLSDLL